MIVYLIKKKKIFKSGLYMMLNAILFNIERALLKSKVLSKDRAIWIKFKINTLFNRV